ncbi:hypothetical protein TraAM80_05220 [Trypanosoma rangeli]|uniref:Uncharacterized protein n=1 Tax=Trypanosoma rangeli TaxID=5698 RepID=A0A422NFS8_TRYRA|nr:uncharacterized protein TraAM80_05220 [Trypanosoma rangeli]RNF04306.1 hypothetical protein TraAM80_05220 [Trypanosoma rangeli]|eukprot:RNF04306.1 hypothetical protein TraAM80_05220 [Trypanosoma rangeli]
MQGWLTQALEEKYIESLQGLDGTDGVYCMAWEHEWYEDGVVMDWSALHCGLVAGTRFPPLAAQLDGVVRFGCCESDDALLVTSIDIRAPWRIIPLSDQAQRLSAFLLPPAEAATSAKSVRGYRFTRGPPGHRSVRDDVYALLQNVNLQLAQGGVRSHVFFGTVIVAANNFEHLMHHTAAVYGALKGAGFDINGNGSSFEPRRVFSVVSGRYWSTLTLGSLRREEDIVAFLVDLFYRWLEDCYVWLCETPPQTLLLSSGNDDRKQQFFSDFYTSLVYPRHDFINLLGVKNMTLTDVLQLAGPRLAKRVPCVGPQKWSALELRLCLAALDAYKNPPRK